MISLILILSWVMSYLKTKLLMGWEKQEERIRWINTSMICNTN